MSSPQVKLCNYTALAEKAALELNENTEEYDYYFNALRTWLSQQSHFRSRTSDAFLLAFLRASKFSLEKAKLRIERFYRYRATLPEIFDKRDLNDDKIQLLLKSGSLLLLPEPLDEIGPRVMVFRPKCFDMTKHNMVDVFRAFFISVDLLLYEDYQAQISGLTVIVDLANLSKAAVLALNPLLMRKLMDALNQHIFPARFNSMHLINIPVIFEMVHSIFKAAISQKLKDRFMFHYSKLDSLYDYIPRRILPKEYGGFCAIDEYQDFLYERIMAQAAQLEEEADYGMLVNTLKETTNTYELDFGISGSFRKINID